MYSWDFHILHLRMITTFCCQHFRLHFNAIVSCVGRRRPQEDGAFWSIGGRWVVETERTRVQSGLCGNKIFLKDCHPHNLGNYYYSVFIGVRNWPILKIWSLPQYNSYYLHWLYKTDWEPLSDSQVPVFQDLSATAIVLVL